MKTKGMKTTNKRYRIGMIALWISSLLLLLPGCQSPGPNTERGAVIGAGAGALGGAIIGHQSGRTLEGMGIGAAAGAAGGALIGNSMDK